MTSRQSLLPEEGYGDDDALYEVISATWYETTDPRGDDYPSMWVLRDDDGTGRQYGVVGHEKVQQLHPKSPWEDRITAFVWIGGATDTPIFFDTMEEARRYVELLLCRVFYPHEMKIPIVGTCDGTPLPDFSPVPIVHIIGWIGGDEPPPGWHLSAQMEALVMLTLTGRLRVPTGRRPEDILPPSVGAMLPPNAFEERPSGEVEH